MINVNIKNEILFNFTVCPFNYLDLYVKCNNTFPFITINMCYKRLYYIHQVDSSFNYLQPRLQQAKVNVLSERKYIYTKQLKSKLDNTTTFSLEIK